MKGKHAVLNEKNLVVQSNSLVESSYTLSVSEQKIILSVVSMIKPDDNDFAPYIFRIADFMALAGIEDQTAYKRIRDFSKGLLEKVIEIKNPQFVLYVNWFSSVKYYDGYVEIKISPELKPYYLGLKEKFTQYQIKHIMQLKSFYSIRIYELLKQYEKFRERTFELDQLKNLLSIKKDKYKLYGHLKERLIAAQAELEEKADISFSFEEIKKRRKVEKIKFYIFKNEKKSICSLENSNKTLCQNNISEVLMNAIPNKEKISSVFNLINQYLKDNFSEDYILSNIKYTEKHAKKNFLIYLKKALLNDYAKDERELAIKVRELEERQKKLLEEESRMAEEREKLKKEKESKEQEHIYFLVSQLPEHDRNKIEKLAAEDMHRFHMKPTITEADKMLYTSIAFKKLGYNKSSNS